MRIVFFISFLGILLNFSSSYNAYAEPICSVSEEKKALIKEALCGKFSSELRYKDSSDGCYRTMLERRALDTA